jgi:hypothetical protein
MSSNIAKGGRIEDLSELLWLAENKKSVVVQYGEKHLYVRPAAFLIGWPLKTLSRYSFYYAVKKATE